MRESDPGKIRTSQGKGGGFRNRVPVLILFTLLGFLSGPVHSGEVTLSWQPNAETDISGYRVYYGTESRQYTQNLGVGKNKTATIKNLDSGRKYYFAVSAYDLSAYEGPLSGELAKLAVDSSVPPPAQYSLTVSKSGTGGGTISGPGISCGTDCTETFAAGTSVTLTVTTGSGGTFGGWMGACTGTGPCTLTMSSDKAVTALFNVMPLPPPTYPIVAKAGPGGSVNPSGTVKVNSGSPQAFTMTPSAGFAIADVKVDGVSQGPVSSYTFARVTSNHSLEASFRPAVVNTYTLTVGTTGEGNGSVHVSPAGPRYHEGTGVTLTAMPSSRSVFAGWSGAGSGSAPSATVTMRSNLSVTADFRLKTSTITAAAGAGGSISPKGSIAVPFGGSQTFTITGSADAPLRDVKVDGVSQGPVASFAFTNVIANHTIEAFFENQTPPEWRTVMAIHCGGPDFRSQSGILYQADAYYSGGGTYATGSRIDGADEDGPYQTERFGNFSYHIPLPNGEYRLTLHLAEIYPYIRPGERVFNVLAEGSPILSHLDLLAKVGRNRAFDFTAPVSVRDGSLDIDFQSVVGHAKVSAIRVDQAILPEEPAMAPEVVLGINCGGLQYVDAAGVLYQADTHFTGGRTYSTPQSVSGTKDSVLYQSERFGNFAYHIPLTGGYYKVVLKLAEIYNWGPGQRVFSVKVGGQEMINNLDLFARAGKFKAYDLELPIHLLADGLLSIEFVTITGNAKVSAIRIERQ